MKFIVALTIIISSCGAQNPDSNFYENGEPTPVAGIAFPTAPNLAVTPGSVCTHPDEYRYPIRVPYCKRDVEPSLKQKIIEQYDAKFGYSIAKMQRTLFKIDHYIPLCMGGSNEANNLWPQHETVYKETDLLEQRLCELMAAGRMTQSDAMIKIKKAKADYKSASKIFEQLPR